LFVYDSVDVSPGTATSVPVFTGTNFGVQKTGVTIDSSNNIVTSGQVTSAQFNGPLNGNASTATTATTANTATNFSGSLSGDVTGTQSATVVSNVSGSATINGFAASNYVYDSVDTTPTATHVPVFSGTNKAVKQTSVTIDSNNNISTAGNLNLTTDPSTSSAGIIQKNGTPFLHNIGNTQSVFVGENAGINNTASGNIGIGYEAMFLNTISGSDNIGIGPLALNKITGGSNNVGIGFGALLNTVGGSNNIGIGDGAGNALSSESNNICIGNIGLSGQTGIYIGTQGTQTSCTIAGIYNTAGTGNPVSVTSSGQLVAPSSSIKYKEDVKELNSNNLLQLQPVTFKYKSKYDKSGETHYGLIAEDVEKTMPELVIYKDGQPESVKYQFLPILLLSELQKLRKTVDSQNDKINQQEIQISQLMKQAGKNL